jgi:hypothetical protein
MCEADTTKRQPEYPEREKPAIRDVLSGLRSLEVSLRPKAKPNTQAHIRDFTIETNSVVATATIRTDGIMRRIVVDWGDGKTDILNARPGIHVGTFPPREPLPPGTYRFQHAYAEPEDRKPFDFFVLVQVEDAAGPDFRIRKITLTPRYRVTNFRTSVALESRCDSIGENSNEFDITQLVDGVPVNQWRWEPSNNFEDRSLFRLEGSQVSRELTLADPPVNVFIKLIEDDPIFDEHLGVGQSLSAAQNSERIELIIRDFDDQSCRVFVTWDRDVRLIVPLPQGPTLELP